MDAIGRKTAAVASAGPGSTPAGPDRRVPPGGDGSALPSGLTRRQWLVAAATWPATVGASAATVADTPLRLALQWRPQSQFAGLYMALDLGLYRQAGLQVELQHADIGRSSLRSLQQRQADAATLWLSDALIASSATPRADDDDRPVLLAQLLQRSSLMLVAWKDMGILQPADLDGQRVSLWLGSFTPAFEAFFRKVGASPERIPQHGSIQLFLRRGVAATAAMDYNERQQIRLAGIDDEQLTFFRLRDFGLGFPEDGLYVRAGWLARHPQAGRALRDATLAGWEHARRHPDDAIQAVLARARAAGVPTNVAHERGMLRTVLASMFGDDDARVPAGRLGPAAFASTVKALQQAALIERAPTLTAFAPLQDSGR